MINTTDAFVPLSLPVLKDTSADSSGFQPLAILGHPPVPAAAATVTSPPPSPHPQSAHAHCEPKVMLQRDSENRVAGIRIECGCGKVVDLACVYE